VSISVICTLELTEEEMLFLLRLRAGEFLVPPPEETGQVKGNETPDSVSIPPTEAEPEIIPVEPPPLPPKRQRDRAKANGAEAPINSTPLAPPPPPPPPEALDEPAMRSLLSKVGAVHPLKVKAITNILENCGGARRLSECDPATWPAIAEAALAALKEHSA
jgi:hypothetical protein